jgi:hypothetical protein
MLWSLASNIWGWNEYITTVGCVLKLLAKMKIHQFELFPEVNRSVFAFFTSFTVFSISSRSTSFEALCWRWKPSFESLCWRWKPSLVAPPPAIMLLAFHARQAIRTVRLIKAKGSAIAPFVLQVNSMSISRMFAKPVWDQCLKIQWSEKNRGWPNLIFTDFLMNSTNF